MNNWIVRTKDPNKISVNESSVIRETPLVDKISIILPTRTRSKQFTELIESIHNTSEDWSNIEICVYVDNDDIESKNTIESLIVKYSSSNLKYTTSENSLNLSEMWNYAYEKLATGNIIMHCGDDIRFRTPNWDTIIRGEFNKYDDKIILVFCKDGIQNENLATHSFVHRKWIEVSGFWLPPYFVSDFNDLWLDVVARGVGRSVYLGNIYTEHLHNAVGKATIDDNTTRRLERHQRESPQSLYDNKYHEREVQINKLKTFIQTRRT